MALTETQQLYEALKNAKSPLVTFQKDHDGDIVSASLALSLLLSKLDKEHRVASHGFKLPKNYDFLPKNEVIKPELSGLRKFIINLNTSKTKPQKIDYEHLDNELRIVIEPEKGVYQTDDLTSIHAEYRHDLIITLGTPDLDALHGIYENHTDFFYHTPILNIDHSTENENYGHYNYVKVTATSISELIFDLIESIDLALIDEKIATCLLTGMIVKTKSFKTPRVTPKSLNIASQLLAMGADREAIIRNLYQTKSVNILKLWGKVLQRVQTDESKRLAWSEITSAEFTETATTPEDIHDIVDEMITNIPTIQITAIFYHLANSRHCLIKTENNHNLLSLLSDYSPQGNKNTVNIQLNESTTEDLLKHLSTLVK